VIILLDEPCPGNRFVKAISRNEDDDCFYYHSWRNNVVIAFGTLSSFLCGHPNILCRICNVLEDLLFFLR